MIFVFVGHQLNKKVELLAGNVIEGGQIQFLGDFIFRHDAVPCSSRDDGSRSFKGILHLALHVASAQFSPGPFVSLF